jgi:Xaa-Pro aminopeptidase
VIDFADLKVDALLVSGLANIRYLTGFTGSNALFLLTEPRASASGILFTDPRYTIQASEECSCKVKTVRGPLVAAVAQEIGRKRLKRIGFEKSRLLFETYLTLKQQLPLGASLRPLGAVVEKLRMVKSAKEIELIRRSVITNSKALEAAMGSFRSGVSESELAAELEYQMRRHGAEKPAFETIVASGPRTALPHAQPTAQRFANNELILIDMGCFQGGYASDMTRMVFLGRPNNKIRGMYQAVLEAQLAAIDAVRDGALARQVDSKARQVLKRRGLEKEFVHSTGHGLGLEIHEPPRLGKREETKLQAGMVVTIEPGVYIRGVGGIRIEDTVLVTANGCEILTPTTKELKLL